MTRNRLRSSSSLSRVCLQSGFDHICEREREREKRSSVEELLAPPDSSLVKFKFHNISTKSDVSKNQLGAKDGMSRKVRNLSPVIKKFIFFPIARIFDRMFSLQGRNQVYGIRDHSLGIGIMDPGSRVTSDGIRISQFFLSWRGSRIDRFLDTLFFMRNKNIPFCKEKGLFSGLLKKLLTFILQFFYVSITQSAV